MEWLINFLKRLFKIRLIESINPRYHLSLDGSYHDKKTKKLIYRFKVFGDHSFVKFSFDEIKKSKQLMYDINPTDLMEISIKEQKEQEKKHLIRVKEILRDNSYKLSSDEIISGADICQNPILIKKIENLDLYKICYNTGFYHGRELSKKISKERSTQNYPPNVIRLRKEINKHGS